MKRISHQLSFYLLGSLATFSAVAAHAQQTTSTASPGHFTASVGTLYAVPNVETQAYASIITPNTVVAYNSTPVYTQAEYDWGIQASLGYIFANTTTGIELAYRGLRSSPESSVSAKQGQSIARPYGGLPVGAYLADFASNQVTNEFNSADLMISHFMDFNQNVYMRFAAGIAYVEIEEENNSKFIDTLTSASDVQKAKSNYQGWGPRLATDGRYHVAQGFGIIAGGSIAYFVGDLNSNQQLHTTYSVNSNKEIYNLSDNRESHAVLNLRGNAGVDYVHFFDDQKRFSLGVELGYLADYYTEALNQITPIVSPFVLIPSSQSNLTSAAFSGPYLNIKGTF